MHDAVILPPEILENIVEFCATDKLTLREISLVSTTCLELARRQLFAKITLQPPKADSLIGGPNIFRVSSVNARVMVPSGSLFVSDSPCATFLAIIEPDSEQRRSRLGTVAPFVRHLHLREGSGMLRWIAADPSLPPLLRALSNLLSFRFSALLPICWARIPLRLRDAISRYVLSQSTLTEVRLSGLVFESLEQMNRLLGSCRGLRTLEVDRSGVKENGEPETETGGDLQKATLDTLILGPFTPMLFVRSFLYPSCPMKVDTIQKLCLSIGNEFSEFAGILHASRSLDTLELVLLNQLDVPKYWTLPPSEQLDLSKLPSLCNLRITFDILQKPDDLLEWLAGVLRTAIDGQLPICPNSMRNLNIVFALFVPRLRVDHLTDAAFFGGWRNVDAVLCGDGQGQTQLHAYSNLERVNLEFVLKKPVNLKFAPRFLDELVLDSPGLKERGLLSVNAVDVGG